MAKRKAKRRTRRNKTINLLNLAEAGIIGNAMTMGFFGTNLRTFLTDGWFKDSGPRYDLYNNSWEVTLGEMFRKPNAGRDAANYPWATVLQKNLTANGAVMVGTMILAPIVKKAVRKMGRPIFTPLNKLLKGTGAKI